MQVHAICVVTCWAATNLGFTLTRYCTSTCPFLDPTRKSKTLVTGLTVDRLQGLKIGQHWNLLE